MELREFAQNLLENVSLSAEMSNNDLNVELATTILEYIEDSGEVNAPEVCNFKKTRARLTAYDYNDEAESLDLFYLIKADNLLGKINTIRINQGFNFLKRFYHEAMSNTLLQSENIEKTDEIAEIASLVQSTQGNISQLRLYILTDGLTDPASLPEAEMDETNDLVTEYNIWDIQHLFQQHNIKAGKEKVDIDFPTDYNIQLQCLRMQDDNDLVDAFMTIIPGTTLAKIYKKYQQVLLEKNVRTFLQFKGKVNKGIRKTLREEPDMFFSYNNGISTTATGIEFDTEDGVEYIVRLKDWQIVNGGQTTASISACLNDKEVDLKKVFVPMKISVIKDSDNSDNIVKAISTCANSQTAIKNSDFSANDPYLIELENLSRAEWVPNGNQKPVCKWFFERTRGQYLDLLSQLSGLSNKNFRKEYPKYQKFTKTDVAKYEMAWKLMPYNVCWGSEQNYKIFVNDIKRQKPEVTPLYYRNLISKGILFKTIDDIVKSKKLGGYKANMNAYLMASISYLSNSKLDLTYIWENQQIQQEVTDRIEELIPVIWNHLTSLNNYGNQSSNVGEWSKKPECWNRLKNKLADYDKFDERFIQLEVNEDGSDLNETQKSRMEEAGSIDANYWFALSNWAKTRNLLTPIERKAAFNFGTMKARNQGMKSLKQAKFALSIRDKAIENGFVG